MFLDWCQRLAAVPMVWPASPHASRARWGPAGLAALPPALRSPEPAARRRVELYPGRAALRPSLPRGTASVDLSRLHAGGLAACLRFRAAFGATPGHCVSGHASLCGAVPCRPRLACRGPTVARRVPGPCVHESPPTRCSPSSTSECAMATPSQRAYFPCSSVADPRHDQTTELAHPCYRARGRMGVQLLA